MFGEDFIDNCKDERLGCYATTDFIKGIGKKVARKLQAVESTGKTQKLWMEYHRMVTVTKTFIRAERLTDFKLHLKSVAIMLPSFAASGHGQYAKAARLALEHVLKFGPQVKLFFYHCGHHTVKYSIYEWGGTWTDMTIEQTLMRFAKSAGGLSRGRLRNESAQKLWLLTLNHCALIHKNINERIDTIKSTTYEHKDLQPARITKDFECFEKLLTWFESTALEDTDPNKLVSFSTGKICDDGVVNSHESRKVGIQIHKMLDGGNFTDKISLKMKCKNFSALKKKVNINNKHVVLEPYKLFNRLAIVSQRQLTVHESLGYELTILPSNLFDSKQLMRKATKAKLGQHLKQM